MNVQGRVADLAARIRRLVGRERVAIVGLSLLGCVPAAWLWAVISPNRIPLPHWDEWFTPGSLLYEWCSGTLDFADFFVQHNESRKVFPRLLYLLLAQLHGWDPRDAMTLVFVEICVLSILLLALLCHTVRAARIAAFTTWVVMTFLCFSPAQYENLLWGIQLETFFPGVAVAAAALANVSKLSLRSRTFCNSTLALVATYTYANGMLLWLLAVPLPDGRTSRRAQSFCYAAYAIIAVAAVAGYFHGYKRPPDLPAWELAGRNPLDLALYAVLWIGAYFRSDVVSASAAGTGALVFAALVFAGSARYVVGTRDWRPFYPWFLLAGYSAVSCGIIAVGRLPLGIGHAMDTRYTAFSLFFYLSVAGLCLALYATVVRKHGPPREFFLTGVGLVVGLAVMAWLSCYQAGVKHLEIRRVHRLTLAHALAWMDVIPDNPGLRYVFPTSQWLFDCVRSLRQCGVLRLQFVGEPLASQVKMAPGETDGSNGGIDACRFDAQGNLIISGWAWLPRQKRPADCVVVGSEDGAGVFKPIGVLRTGESRPDLRDHFQQPKMITTGFAWTMNSSNIPRGPVTITAWAVDLKKQRAYPLGGRHSPKREEMP